MHPMLMTMFAEAHAAELQSNAEARRRQRLSRSRKRRRFLPHLPRRATQVAHA
ncbi:MAG TPA: hypothetical protein VFZ00_13210 [Solirubrobacter sp.]|nr:hypothetical protein [Solirubrobacter sp.]